MRRLALFLALLALIASLPAGPGWARAMAQEAPSTATSEMAGELGNTESENSEPIELRAPVDPRAESPARSTLRIEPPERSLIDSRALRASIRPARLLARAGFRALGERLPAGQAPSPARHLELCVFLC